MDGWINGRMEEQNLTSFLMFPVCSGLIYEAQLNCLSVALSLSISRVEQRWRWWKSGGGGKESRGGGVLGSQKSVAEEEIAVRRL